MVFMPLLALLALPLADAVSHDSWKGGGRLRGNDAPRSDTDQDMPDFDSSVMEELLSGGEEYYDCSGADNVTIGGEEMFKFNSNADSYVLLLHGWDLNRNDTAKQYCNLAKYISSWGYCVIVPRGNGDIPVNQQPWRAPAWAVKNAVAVQNYIPSGSKIALVGHSLGGGAALHVAENPTVPAFRAYVASHPATLVATRLFGYDFSDARGPILFTMGTADQNPVYERGGVSEEQIGLAYKEAQHPKAYVDVKGNGHSDAIMLMKGFGGYERKAMRTWLDCFLNGDVPQTQCASFETDICAPGIASDALKTCNHAWIHGSI